MKLEHQYELFKSIAAGAEESLGVTNDFEVIEAAVNEAVDQRYILLARHPERMNALGQSDESYAIVHRSPRGHYVARGEILSGSELTNGIWLDEILDVIEPILAHRKDAK